MPENLNVRYYNDKATPLHFVSRPSVCLRLRTSSCPSVPRPQGRGKTQCRRKVAQTRGEFRVEGKGFTLKGTPNQQLLKLQELIK